ncbi:hypothetical protein DOTSEDRAFT_159128 [Dothistroma septosporum NZE10]|uniref:Uncharacterized protein n=1 Tax=Dothistroma septosporum (strain NZE10 / CBS 128990) TaxID=675120 RepID=N1PG96_DOTSN|nr:hypothetical protein DOTSEDRAFT_159128 [Dothistroma septosporum NZE10]
MPHKPLAIIAGVGSGLGSSLARRFSKSYIVILLARTEKSFGPVVDEIKQAGGEAVGVSTDISNPESVKDSFKTIGEQYAGSPVAVAIFNASGGFVRKSLLDVTVEEMEKSVGVSIRGAMLFAQSAIPLLLKYEESSPTTPPSLFFTGSTAAIKPNPLSLVMTVPRHGLRALSMSAAKEFGPKGIHVVHSIVDGAIDTPWGESFLKNVPESQKIDPAAIAEMYWDCHLQSRRGWSNEVDCRAWEEKW